MTITVGPRRRSGRPLARRCALAVLLPVIVTTGVMAMSAAPASSAPELKVPAATVAKALTCTGNLKTSKRRPVLFIHGTTSNSQANWSWNWARALNQRGWAHCELDLPRNGNDNIAVSAEYVTRAIRMMHRRAERKISIVGHSQGGMIARWSFKFWPDTRRMVEDYVSLAGSNHGSAVGRAECDATRQCTAASWQQSRGSNFLRALNQGRETYPGIDYTQISTDYDELVNPASSPFLAGDRSRVTNTSVQDVCPLEAVDHFGMAYSNAAWLIGFDALTHQGPAKLSRLPRATCGAPYMPGVDGSRFAFNAAAAMSVTAQSSLTATQVSREPRLPAYAR